MALRPLARLLQQKQLAGVKETRTTNHYIAFRNFQEPPTNLSQFSSDQFLKQNPPVCRLHQPVGGRAARPEIKRLLIIFRFNTSCFTSCQGSPTTGDQPSEYISGRLPRHSQPPAPKPTDIRTESRTRALVLQNNLDAIYGSNIPQLFQPQYNPLTLF